MEFIGHLNQRTFPSFSPLVPLSSSAGLSYAGVWVCWRIETRDIWRINLYFNDDVKKSNWLLLQLKNIDVGGFLTILFWNRSNEKKITWLHQLKMTSLWLTWSWLYPPWCPPACPGARWSSQWRASWWAPAVTRADDGPPAPSSRPLSSSGPGYVEAVLSGAWTVRG